MFIAETGGRGKPKRTRCILLKEAYRENGKPKSKTIANLTKLPQKTIDAIKLAIDHQDDLAQLVSLPKACQLQEGSSLGAVWCVCQLAKRLGIQRALGTSHQAKLALWQIIARVIDQGSRLSAVRLANVHAACDCLGIDQSFNEDSLYNNLTWLADHQQQIEDKLFAIRRGKTKPELFLYDVTSSYLEGDHNALGAYGYNRDRKQSKKQIVIGMLEDETGAPLSVEVFRGNTGDVSTFASQVSKVAQQFGTQRVTFVGDRGMIKSAQIQDLHQAGFHYITAITKAQIRKLIKAGTIQMELFEQNVCEVVDEQVRYVLRRNPDRAVQIAQNRLDKKAAVERLIKNKNDYLKEHPKAEVQAALEKVNAKIARLKLVDYLSVTAEDRNLSLQEDCEELAKLSELDGCYVIKSDLPTEVANATTIHDRYKDLALVELTFRTAKTAHLQVRPVYVRRADRTRGHVLVVMLAYMIVRELRRLWIGLNVTVAEGIAQLSTLCSMKLEVATGGSCHMIPSPRSASSALLKSAGIELPSLLPDRRISVVSRKTLSESA